MVDKKPTSDTWPVVSGDYIVGDPESPVAVVTLASHNFRSLQNRKLRN